MEHFNGGSAPLSKLDAANNHRRDLDGKEKEEGDCAANGKSSTGKGTAIPLLMGDVVLEIAEDKACHHEKLDNPDHTVDLHHHSNYASNTRIQRAPWM